MPQRIQLSRVKGWRMPENTVKVDRSTRWGNPFTVTELLDAGYDGGKESATIYCVNAFDDWLRGDDSNWMGEKSDRVRSEILSRIGDLCGKNLACWCKPGTPCHADVLLEMANREATP